MYKVYWTDRNGKPDAEEYDKLDTALAVSNGLRNDGFRYVTMVAEDINCTSKLGVDTVADVSNYNGWISRKHDREA